MRRPFSVVRVAAAAALCAAALSPDSRTAVSARQAFEGCSGKVDIGGGYGLPSWTIPASGGSWSKAAVVVADAWDGTWPGGPPPCVITPVIEPASATWMTVSVGSTIGYPPPFYGYYFGRWYLELDLQVAPNTTGTTRSGRISVTVTGARDSRAYSYFPIISQPSQSVGPPTVSVQLPASSTLPTGVPGAAPLDASITCTGAPSQSCDVTLTAAASPSVAAGHVGHGGVRPAGAFDDGLGNVSQTFSRAINGGTTVQARYVPPAASGVVQFSASCVAPAVCPSSPSQLLVGVGGLAKLSSSFFRLEAGNSHGTEGDYAIPAVNAKLDALGRRFDAIWRKKGWTLPSAAALSPNCSPRGGDGRRLLTGGMSLPLGGLYDTNGTWQTPHKSHRHGVDVDVHHMCVGAYALGSRLNVQQRWLEGLIAVAGGAMLVARENPADLDSDHWHVRFSRPSPPAPALRAPPEPSASNGQVSVARQAVPGCPVAQGPFGLTVTLNVSSTGPVYRYEYTVTNSLQSSAPLSLFTLDALAPVLTAFAPAGWTRVPPSDDGDVAWFGENGGLQPAASATFVVESVFPPAQAAFRADADEAIPIVATEADAEDLAEACGTAIAPIGGVIDGPVAVGQDGDGDGLDDAEERRFGLDPNDGAGSQGGAGDPDGDGIDTRTELAQGTHPIGRHSSYFAEGTTSNTFRTVFAVVNPGTVPARVLMRFQRDDGVQERFFLMVPAGTRRTLDAATDLPGLYDTAFATQVESDEQVLVDRTIVWDRNEYGSDAETAIASPSPTWYLAEGATHGTFDLFYLIQNPNRTSADVEITFLLPPPALPISKTVTVPPETRRTLWVDTLPGLDNTDVSAAFRVTNGQPIIVERAMYASGPSGTHWAAGHSSAGVVAPANRWFLAEGATGSLFDMFVLLANPAASSIVVDLTYLLDSGVSFTKPYDLPPFSRRTVWVDYEDPRLANASVSVIAQGRHGADLLVERSMWWPGPTPATWTEAHNSAGTTLTGTLWGLADGEVGGPRKAETYVLIANASSVSGSARVTLLLEDGTRAEKIVGLAPNSRKTVGVQHEPEFQPAIGRAGADGLKFGVLVESLGVSPAEIVVERAMYSQDGGPAWFHPYWPAGTDALATRLR